MALVVARRMSLINKMLQDLDRRQALGTGAEAGVLRPASADPRHREWFWRVVTLLLLVGVGWVLWTAYQLLPRPLVTDLAFRAAEEARARKCEPCDHVVERNVVVTGHDDLRTRQLCEIRTRLAELGAAGSLVPLPMGEAVSKGSVPLM